MRPSKKGLGIPVASWLPEVEGETLAVGVSSRALGVMDGDSAWTVATRSPQVGCTVWAAEGETLGDGSRLVCSVL